MGSKSVSFWGSCVQHAYNTRAILGHHQCLAREQDEKGLRNPSFWDSYRWPLLLRANENQHISSHLHLAV